MGTMTGDAPQPGQTPRSEGTPWAWSDPGTGAWWPRDSPSPPDSPEATRTLEPPKQAEHTGAAGAAHEAGMQDVATALTGAAARPATPAEPALPAKPAEPARQDEPHDTVDDERFNTEGSTTAYAARSAPEPEPADPEHEPTIVDLLAALPVGDPRPARHIEGETVEDVMILPEPERERPTVALPRPSRSGRSRQDQARADRALQDRVRAERTAALLETSPFWGTEQGRTGEERPAPTRDRPAPAPRRTPRDPRRPLGGLIALLALGLVAAFFSWVSAEPFWLAVGHGRNGTATVERCTGSGVTQRCTGTFVAAGGAYSVPDLALLGVEPKQKAAGSVVSARIVSTTSRQAFVGGTGTLLHLRWTLGFLLVLLCGFGIAGLTGASRLENAQARRGALLISLAGPLVLLAGFLVATY
jgi:hypothetical protein